MSEGVPPKPHETATLVASSAAFSAAGAYDQDEAGDNAFLKALVLGNSGHGKTTAILTTAPGPIGLINCDGRDATAEAARQNAKYQVLEVGTKGTRAAWKKAFDVACKAATNGEIRTLVLDSFTLLQDNLFDEIDLTETGFDRFSALNTELLPRLKKLRDLPCHVFVIGHLSAPYRKDDPEAEGIMPMGIGKPKSMVPTLFPNKILFDYQHGRTPERMFVLGPQGNWTYGCRRATKKHSIAADVRVLLDSMGISA